jgi:hypothetical protein
MIRWAGHLSDVGETRNAYRVLVRNAGEMSPLGRTGCRWEVNVRKRVRLWTVLNWIRVGFSGRFF